MLSRMLVGFVGRSVCRAARAIGHARVGIRIKRVSLLLAMVIEADGSVQWASLGPTQADRGTQVDSRQRVNAESRGAGRNGYDCRKCYSCSLRSS